MLEDNCSDVVTHRQARNRGWWNLLLLRDLRRQTSSLAAITNLCWKWGFPCQGAKEYLMGWHKLIISSFKIQTMDLNLLYQFSHTNVCIYIYEIISKRLRFQHTTSTWIQTRMLAEMLSYTMVQALKISRAPVAWGLSYSVYRMQQRALKWRPWLTCCHSLCRILLSVVLSKRHTWLHRSGGDPFQIEAAPLQSLQPERQKLSGWG